MTKFILNTVSLCPGTSSLVYLGGGSGNGELAITGTGAAPLNVVSQQGAPMSRALRGGPVSATNPAPGLVCATKAGSPATAENIFMALDGLSIVAASSAVGTGGTCTVGFSNPATGNSKSIPVTDANGVAGLDCPGCTGSNYTVAANDWRDILKVIYAGVHHNSNFKDCNSDVRHSIANNFGSLFEATCTGTFPCTQLLHAFRRADVSGTTDSFLAILGLPAIASNPFCNGVGAPTPFTAGQSDFLDRDPVRRACQGRGITEGEQVCNTDGRLGLVTVINVPESFTTGTVLLPAEIYPTAQCTPGFFEWKDTPAQVPKCADGTDPIVGTCLIPFENAAAGPNYACINRRSNPNIFTPSGVDSRVYNLHLRRGNGTFLRDINRRFLTGSFYRIHTTVPITGGTPGGCRLQAATTQIGCLAGASPCSFGYAGREADSQPGAIALLVRGLGPTTTNIQNLITTPTNAADDYPFARKLYFNSVIGFENMTGEEATLARCFADAGKAKQAAEAVGFVEVPGGPKCEDFHEELPVDSVSFGCGAPTNNNACANNAAAGFPTGS